MIRINGESIGLIRYGNIAISTVWYGAVKVWEASRSCFGRGWWEDSKPWLDEESWKD